MKYYNFGAFIRVWDSRDLYAAACRQLQKDDAEIGDTTTRSDMEDQLGTAADPDIGACLVMLLDPGQLAGCCIDGTSARESE